MSVGLCKWIIGAVAVAYTGTCFAENRGSADEAVVVFGKKDGAWEQSRNWIGKNIPGKGDSVVIYDVAVSLSSKVSSISTLRVGGDSSAKLTLKKGAILGVSEKCFVGRNKADTQGMLVIDGGVLRTNLNGKTEISKLYVGESSTDSCQATAVLASGTFTGGLWIGSPLARTGVGMLRVLGSRMNISGDSPEDSVTCNYGTIEFVFDKKGVSPLLYPKGNARFVNGAVIRIDGSAYLGRGGVFPLIRYRKLINNGVRVLCEGVSDRYKVSPSFGKDALVVEISLK